MTLTSLQTLIFILQSAMPLLLLAVIVTFGILVFRFRSVNRKKHVVRLMTATALLCVFGLALSLVIPQEYVARREQQRRMDYAANSFVNVGDPVPSFIVTDTDGNDFSPRDLRGKVLLINFFATWCGPCKLELPHLDEINTEFQENSNFEFIVIGRGETQESVREFQAMSGLTMRMAADSDETVFAEFASSTIPRTVVVSPSGSIVYSKAGFYERDVAVIRKAIENHL